MNVGGIADSPPIVLATSILRAYHLQARRVAE
jgi:hypothetical protein